MMKGRVILCLVLMLCWIGAPVFAEEPTVPDFFPSASGSSTSAAPNQTNTNTNTNTNPNTNTNTNTNTNSLANVVTGSPVQSSLATSTSDTTQLSQTYVVYESSQQNIPNNAFFPQVMPLISGGRVGDVTDQLPSFAGMKKLRLPSISNQTGNHQTQTFDPGETVNPDKIASFSGHWYCRIGLEDIWQKIVSSFRKQQKRGWDPAKMRYRVYYKDRATGSGLSLGGNGGAAYTTMSGHSVQGSIGSVLGYASSMADPVYIVMICEVVEGPQPPPPPSPQSKRHPPQPRAGEVVEVQPHSPPQLPISQSPEVTTVIK